MRLLLVSAALSVGLCAPVRAQTDSRFNGFEIEIEIEIEIETA